MKKLFKFIWKLFVRVIIIMGVLGGAIYGYFLWDKKRIQELADQLSPDLIAQDNMLAFIESHPGFYVVEFNQADKKLCLRLKVTGESYLIEAEGEPSRSLPSPEEAIHFLENFQPPPTCPVARVVYFRHFIWKATVTFKLTDGWKFVENPVLEVHR